MTKARALRPLAGSILMSRSADHIAQELKAERRDLAILEAQYHYNRITGFYAAKADPENRTVKDFEFAADNAALSIHQDLLLHRAKVRSLEDELRVALHGT